jgi:iron complex outermembrane receptor protein
MPYYIADEAVPVVVISASRNERLSFELPAAIDVIDAARIGDGQPRVNASETLATVPGLLALNRQNYAQDLQISSRGQGARSAFGVRGVRLIADGIPATMPDGQGQAATFNLDRAERIEVLRGPYSAIYGNHAGGVVQLFTQEGKAPASLAWTQLGGSDGMRKTDLSAQGLAGGIGYVLDASRFDTDGFRQHSAARRDQQAAKVTVTPSAQSKLTFIANSLQQRNTQDPLGVQWSSFVRDPRAAEIDLGDSASPKRSYAERYDTRKSIDHQQLGARYELRLGEDRLQWAAYGGNRRVQQFQAFSKAFQAPPSHGGGVVDFDRRFYGTTVSWLHVMPLGGGTLRSTLGIDIDRSTDERRGYENFIGNLLGVRGALRRAERDTVTNDDPYWQAEWERGRWIISAGLRRSRVQVNVDDHFISNGDDSGHLRFAQTTPVAGLLYKAAPAINLYASAAHGFETPTLNELFYSGTGGGFNFSLRPAHSTHLEAGIKTQFNAGTRADLALFHIGTQDELIVDAASGGRTSYRNAGRTTRRGAELSVDSALSPQLHGRLAMTFLHAVYDESFGNVRAGSRLPGVPHANAFGELAWHRGSTTVAVEAQANARTYVEDSNQEHAAPGYGLLHLRLQTGQDAGRWRITEFLRLNNLLDRSYVGSVIVGDTNKRYYEAAPGRNWVAGITAQWRWGER